MLAGDPDDHLVEMPAIARPRTAAPQPSDCQPAFDSWDSCEDGHPPDAIGLGRTSQCASRPWLAAPRHRRKRRCSLTRCPVYRLPASWTSASWFVADSLLEERVSSELVSEAEFPASWEKAGNFVRLGLRVHSF